MEHKGESVWGPHQPHPPIHYQKHLNTRNSLVANQFSKRNPLLTVHNTYVANIKLQNILNGKEPQLNPGTNFQEPLGSA